jgi:site-specific DNA-methyltransferase (adenine-specific)
MTTSSHREDPASMPRANTPRTAGGSLPFIAPALISAKGVLYQADCLTILPGIESNSVDCVFADPPFNLGKDYGSRNAADRMSDQEYWAWTARWILECTRILKPGGSLFIYHLPRWLVRIGGFLDSMDNMQFRNWIAIKMKNSFPVKNRLHPAHYGLLYYVKPGRKSKFHVLRMPSPVCRHCGKLIRDYGGYQKKYKTVAGNSKVPLIRLADVWDDTGPNIHRKSRPKAVNELPLSIPERAIQMSTNRGDIVFDPFAGGGSTLHAAEKNGRYWLGCEIGTTTYARDRLMGQAQASERTTAPRKITGVLRVPLHAASSPRKRFRPARPTRRRRP